MRSPSCRASRCDQAPAATTSCRAMIVRPCLSWIATPLLRRHDERRPRPCTNVGALRFGIAPDRLAESPSGRSTVFQPGTKVPLTKLRRQAGLHSRRARRLRHGGRRCRSARAPPSRAATRGTRPRSRRARASRPRAAWPACRSGRISAHPFGFGELHQRRPARRGRLVVAGGAGAPEAPQPGQQLRQIGRRDGQRPERVGQPFRQVAASCPCGRAAARRRRRRPRHCRSWSPRRCRCGR